MDVSIGEVETEVSGSANNPAQEAVPEAHEPTPTQDDATEVHETTPAQEDTPEAHTPIPLLFIPENLEQLEYLMIAERGRPVLEVGFIGTNEEKNKMLESYGMIFMSMIALYPDRELYYTNLWNLAFNEFQSFSLAEFVELSPDDLSIYGLDDPSLEIMYYDYFRENETHIIFGDQTGGGMVYCMVDGQLVQKKGIPDILPKHNRHNI